MNKLYHREIYFKPIYDTITATLINKPYKLSYHLLDRLESANKSHDASVNGIDNAINYIRKNNIKAFEFETENNKLIKCVVRCKYDDKEDISIVFLDKGNYTLIKTIWLNANSDKHKTLDREKYQYE